MEVVLVDRHEAKDVEYEEKVKWLRTVLGGMGVPMEDWPETPSMENLRKMRRLLRSLSIDIIDDTDDGLLVYWNNALVAEWLRPFYKMIEDPSERDPKYRFYYEMHLRKRSVFEDAEGENA